MRLIYVHMQHEYLDMQHSYVNMFILHVHVKGQKYAAIRW